MAERLSSERAGNGITGPEFLEYYDRYDAVEDELSAAQETVRSIRRRRKDLRKVMFEEGIDIGEFDRARADAGQSGELRELRDAKYRQYMVWLQKPIGEQGNFVLVVAEPTERDLHKVDAQGLEAGKRGDRADSNPWTPGRVQFQRWHSSWLRGQALAVKTHIKPPEPAEPKRRGRPRKEHPANGAEAPEGTVVTLPQRQPEPQDDPPPLVA